MNNLAAGRTDPFESSLQVIDREVDQAETVARAGPSLVDPKCRAIPVRLPPLTLPFLSRLHLHCEHPGPEGPSPLRVVRGELHKRDRRRIGLAGRLGGHDARV